jgi:TldD protein
LLENKINLYDKELIGKIKFIHNFDYSLYNIDYADIRLCSKKKSNIFYQDFSLHTGGDLIDEGAFLRVLKNGKWAYASTNNIAEIPQLMKGLSKTVSALLPDNTFFSENLRSLYCNSFEGSCENQISFRFLENNVSNISIQKKKRIIDECLPVFRDRLVVSNSISYQDFYEIRIYSNSSGCSFVFDSNICGAAASYVLKDKSEIYSTSCLIDGGVNLSDLKNISGKLREDIKESKKFIGAPSVKPGDYTVILSPKASGVFAHESFGHKSEADFMLGDDKMKQEWKMGMTVGSELLSIIDDPTFFPSPGNILYDDEGVKGKKTYLVKKGKLSGRLHSKKTAMDLKEEPQGNGRGMDYSFEPIVRMTTTYIEPGNMTFSDLIKDIEYGIYIKEIKHGSGMSTFTIAPDRSYMIRNGKICDPVKVSVISGSVFETLGLIDGVADDLMVPVSPFTGCGKMEQFPLHVGIGGPSIRVKKMKVS